MYDFLWSVLSLILFEVLTGFIYQLFLWFHGKLQSPRIQATVIFQKNDTKWKHDCNSGNVSSELRITAQPRWLWLPGWSLKLCSYLSWFPSSWLIQVSRVITNGDWRLFIILIKFPHKLIYILSRFTNILFNDNWKSRQ